MSPLMSQLRDIAEVDAPSMWPLSIGCWICLAVGLMMLIGAGRLLWRRLKYLRSWQRDAMQKLGQLEHNLSSATAQETVSSLSEYLRRIAVRRFPRKECAGLVGQGWLTWLTEHDPKKFDWTRHGKLLVDLPYAPKGGDIPLQQIKEMIKAIRHWVT